MKKKLPITKNKDVVVSWVYTWSKQQDMSIHEQRIVLRILEACQAELKGVKLKDYAGTKRKFEHGLWDVDAQMHVSDVIFSGRDYNEIIAALDSLAGRFFTYEDDEEWWKCGFISNPKYKKHTGIITFRVSNDLWDVFTKFAKGYREFELNKALALPTGYSLRFYMLMSGQVYPLDISLDNLKDRLGIPADKYKDKNGKDRIDNFEERVLKPAKAALDESCPYTFNYVKVRENPNNKRSKVTGFRFYPVYQPQFRDEELEGKELQRVSEMKNVILEHLYHKPLIDPAELLNTLHEYRDMIAPFVCDVSAFLDKALKEGKTILLEGQLGTMKDPDHGIYPIVTSSSTLAAYGAIGAGIPPYEIKQIVTVSKAYSSSVGAGAFVSEIFGDEADELRRRGGDGGEFGATTGRPRRMGWFDCVATKYGCRLQGATDVAFTVLDALGYLDEIPVCVGYEIDGEVTTDFPVTYKLEKAKPVLKKLPGWKCDIRGIRNFDELPENCRKYVEFIEEQIGFPITLVSNGPGREDIIYRESPLKK